MAGDGLSARDRRAQARKASKEAAASSEAASATKKGRKALVNSREEATKDLEGSEANRVELREAPADQETPEPPDVMEETATSTNSVQDADLADFDLSLWGDEGRDSPLTEEEWKKGVPVPPQRLRSAVPLPGQFVRIKETVPKGWTTKKLVDAWKEDARSRPRGARVLNHHKLSRGEALGLLAGYLGLRNTRQLFRFFDREGMSYIF